MITKIVFQNGTHLVINHEDMSADTKNLTLMGFTEIRGQLTSENCIINNRVIEIDRSVISTMEIDNGLE